MLCRLLLLFGWVQRLPRGGGEGERGGHPGRGTGQGRSQDKRGRESGQTRRDNRACVLVTDRARERGRDPMPRGSQRRPWVRAGRGTVSPVDLAIFRHTLPPFWVLEKSWEGLQPLIQCPPPAPLQSAGQPAHFRSSLHYPALKPADPPSPTESAKDNEGSPFHSLLHMLGVRVGVHREYLAGSEGKGQVSLLPDPAWGGEQPSKGRGFQCKNHPFLGSGPGWGCVWRWMCPFLVPFYPSLLLSRKP